MNQEGVGLGLNIAKKLSEALSFKVTVDSQVGLGTIFTLSTPFTKEQEYELSTTQIQV